MSTKVKGNYSYLLIKWIISIIGPIIILLIPENELFTSELRVFLAISLWLILSVALSIFESMFVPAFLAPVLWYMTGCVPINIAFSAWTQEVLYVIIGAYLLASQLEEVGLLKRIAYWVILKFGGSFKGTYWGIFVACAFVTFITFGNAYIVLATITFGICKAFNLGTSRESAFIVMSACVGTTTSRTFIYSPQTVGLIEAGIRTVHPDFSLTWYDYMIQMAPNIIMCIVILWAYGKIFGLKKVNVQMEKEYFIAQLASLGKISSTEKKAGIVLLSLMAFLITSPLHGLPANYGFLVLPLLYFVPGINIGTKQTIRNIDFSLIFFAASCLSIGVVGNYLGLGKLIVAYLSPIVSIAGAAGAAYIVMTLGIAVNFVLTPTAMMAALPASIAALADGLGVSALSLIYPFKMSTDLIFLPYEYIPYLIFFSFGMMKTKDFVAFSTVKIIINYIFLGVIMIPWWKILGIA